MATEDHQASYEGCGVQNYQVYLKYAEEHKSILWCIHNILAGEFKRIGEGKSSLDVLGVGSGGGEMDTEILTLLQSTFPTVPITADVVEGSSELIDSFKARVAKSTNLQKIPFTWNLMDLNGYEGKVKAKGDMKKFDIIHMIQMIYYVENLADYIKFYHSLLKNNGRIMIIAEAGNAGTDMMWKSFRPELKQANKVEDFRSSSEVVACLKSLGLKYEEHIVSKTVDISECFNPNSQIGKCLLDFITAKDFHSFTPEVRAGILDVLRKNSTEKDGKVLFKSDVGCILVYA